MNNTIYLYIICCIGIVSRTLIPYLLILRDKPDTQFDKKFLAPLVISIIINLLAAPVVLGSLPPGIGWIAAYVFGWGATDIGRDAIKFAGGYINILRFLK